jgi:hypothetical protein
MADAYLDGELDPRDVSKFETHAAGCTECAAMMEAGRVLKASLGAVPMVEAPRSFRITPALLQERAPARASVRVTPVLMVARFGAAASVAAFAVVGTLQFSSSSDEPTTAASPMYELSTAAGAAEDTKVDGADGDAAGGDDDSDEVVPLATEDPQIAPPPSADVGGAGVPEATPAPGEVVPDQNGDEPQPADDGARNTNDPGANLYGEGAADTMIRALPEESDAADYGPWLVVLGGVSIVSLAAVGSLEYRRRRA